MPGALDSVRTLVYTAPMHEPAPFTGLPFMKMHGLGNDFVILDGRGGLVVPGAQGIAAMADRHRGVGFDQLAVIRQADDADLGLEFVNADGSASAACGNATR